MGSVGIRKRGWSYSLQQVQTFPPLAWQGLDSTACYCLFVSFWRQGSLCSCVDQAGPELTEVCLLNTGIKGVRHHWLAFYFMLKKEVAWWQSDSWGHQWQDMSFPAGAAVDTHSQRWGWANRPQAEHSGPSTKAEGRLTVSCNRHRNPRSGENTDLTGKGRLG